MFEDRYYSQTTGENEQMEREALAKFFPLATIEKVHDKELQLLGVDYIAKFGARKAYIDCKVHHYDSNYFVYECFDTRPGYKDFGWTNTKTTHLTTYIVYIVPAISKAYLYDYKSILAFQNTDAFKFAEYTETKHKNGITYNKVFDTDFIKSRQCDITVPADIVIKPNCVVANKTSSFEIALKQLANSPSSYNL